MTKTTTIAAAFAAPLLVPPLLGVGLFSVAGIVSLVYVVLGLGLVIFFHELGHFAVAKWCNVKVERFSLGFGPILWRYKRGETEYALSAIPFGGYVKMLGQDDMDPSQLTQEEIALDPRSFSAKSVPQRMAIISAGVIMNVITGLLFFAIAFGMGVRQLPPVVGGAEVGYPAWEAGIREGDTITEINGRRINSFLDIRRAVALSSSDHLVVKGVRADGETTFDLRLRPLSPRNTPGVTRRIVGVGLMPSLELAEEEPVDPGSPAAGLDVPAAGTLLKANGEELADYAELESILVRGRGENLVLQIAPARKDAEPVSVTIPPRPFREIGLTFEVGLVEAIREGSPAEVAGIEPGDKITHVVTHDATGDTTYAVGNDVDPFRLPDLLAEHAGESVDLRFTREEKGGERRELTASLVPEDRAGWTETPSRPDAPLSIPSIGLAFHVLPRVLSAEGAAAGKVQPGARLVAWELVPKKGPDGKPVADGAEEEDLELKFDEDQTVAYAFWLTQQLPGRTVRLTFAGEGADARPRVVNLVPRPAEDWFVPDLRGLRLYPVTREMVADDLGDALGLAFTHTRNSIEDIYLTLRNLFTRDLSPTELHGPVGIAKVAYQIAHEGLSPLLLFLGFLSMNLAVLNFLPIPLLDGGHMVFLIWEGVTRRKPSEGVLVAATYVGMAFVLGLLGFVLYLDLFVHKG